MINLKNEEMEVLSQRVDKQLGIRVLDECQITTDAK